MVATIVNMLSEFWNNSEDHTLETKRLEIDDTYKY